MNKATGELVDQYWKNISVLCKNIHLSLNSVFFGWCVQIYASVRRLDTGVGLGRQVNEAILVMDYRVSSQSTKTVSLTLPPSVFLQSNTDLALHLFLVIFLGVDKLSEMSWLQKSHVFIKASVAGHGTHTAEMTTLLMCAAFGRWRWTDMNWQIRWFNQQAAGT